MLIVRKVFASTLAPRVVTVRIPSFHLQTTARPAAKPLSRLLICNLDLREIALQFVVIS
jgi:hypothetical protein